MKPFGLAGSVWLAGLLMMSPCGGAGAEAEPQAPPARAAGARDLFLTVGKSIVIDSPVDIERVSVANGDVAEAVAVNPREVLINGKAAGDTSVIIWQQGGNRMFFDLTVRPGTGNVDVVRQEIQKELGQQDVTIDFENNTVFLRGTAKDLTAAQRAAAIAGTLGKVVNLLRVVVPPTEAQILLKVRFADVDRAATTELGFNYFSTGADHTPASVTTGQFSPPQINASSTQTTLTLTDALNIFLLRRDLNLGATIKALQSRRLLQILAEPNVLAINGKSASFLAGGEFPFPTLQGGGAGLGAVTIQFREFGVRINFVPVITPRGTIRLEVSPEVSSLDFSNGLVFQGFNIPALSTRRVRTEIELESGQSFGIGGLLDNRLTESLSKIPGLGDIPFLGKLFQSRSVARNNSELLVLVTPELVRPIPAGQPLPEVKMPGTFLKDTAAKPPQTPGMNVTGVVPVKPVQETVPVEKLIESQQPLPSSQPGNQPQLQFVPVLTPQAPASPAAPAPMAPPRPGEDGAKSGN